MRSEGLFTIVRRQFLSWLCVGLGGAAAAVVGVPFIGFLVAPLLRRVPRTWRQVGPVERFPVGKVTLVSYVDPSPLPWGGVTSNSAVYIRRTGEHDWMAFSVHCSHLGCPVRWLPDAELFMCPCHGGVYYANGTVAAGPPPRPLVQVPLRERSGQVEVMSIPIPIT